MSEYTMPAPGSEAAKRIEEMEKAILAASSQINSRMVQMAQSLGENLRAYSGLVNAVATQLDGRFTFVWGSQLDLDNSYVDFGKEERETTDVFYTFQDNDELTKTGKTKIAAARLRYSVETGQVVCSYCDATYCDHILKLYEDYQTDARFFYNIYEECNMVNYIPAAIQVPMLKDVSVPVVLVTDGPGVELLDRRQRAKLGAPRSVFNGLDFGPFLLGVEGFESLRLSIQNTVEQLLADTRVTNTCTASTHWASDRRITQYDDMLAYVSIGICHKCLRKLNEAMSGAADLIPEKTDKFKNVGT